nr:hypothetical protein [Lachnospiraceae bacterium]
MSPKNREMKWDKLDNTALLFPVIANESMSSVYRISVTLKEEVQEELLQKALDKVLPLFDVFHARLRRGLFWYYFETNTRPAPKVKEETSYPCLYIPLYQNNNYLFRVTYYKRRINLEVFHVLTDGMGAITFLRELVYQYLRYTHPSLMENLGDGLSSDTTLNKEDSYIKNYSGKKLKKKYKTERAYELKGEFLPPNALSVIHGYMNVEQVKAAAKEKGVSINTYLVGLYTYSIYKEMMWGDTGDKPISICVPVNLRPYYNSITIKNFFAMVEAVFRPEKDDYTLDEILAVVDASLKEQLTKENMDSLIAYNVGNEMNRIHRIIPLFLKRLAMKWVYRSTALSNTSTVTNLGEIKIRDAYKPYIERFHIILSMTKGQNMKCNVCTYGGELVYTISTKLADGSVQKRFFRTLAEEGIDVTIETNGEGYDI